MGEAIAHMRKFRNRWKIFGWKIWR